MIACSASQAGRGFHRALSAAWRSKVERLVSLSCVGCRGLLLQGVASSLNRQFFWIAITALAAKFVTSAICFSVNRRFLGGRADGADRLVVLEHQDGRYGAIAAQIDAGADESMALDVGLCRLCVVNLERLFRSDDPAQG